MLMNNNIAVVFHSKIIPASESFKTKQESFFHLFDLNKINFILNFYVLNFKVTLIFSFYLKEVQHK